MTNSTLVVQIFFIMSSFLLAHKLLQQRRRGEHVPPFSTFMDTMFNRIIRSNHGNLTIGQLSHKLFIIIITIS